VSLRQEFPTAWAKLVSASPAATAAEIAIDASRFPSLPRHELHDQPHGRGCLCGLKDPSAASPSTVDLRVMDLPNAPSTTSTGTTSTGAKSIPLSRAVAPTVLHGAFVLTTMPALDGEKPWSISVANAGNLKDLFLLISYRLTKRPDGSAP
jgi:hypothetical protein